MSGFRIVGGAFLKSLSIYCATEVLDYIPDFISRIYHEAHGKAKLQDTMTKTHKMNKKNK